MELNLSGEDRLLFENDACLVINKLAGESSEQLTAGAEKLFPAHRLDVPVTGCLLLARNPVAAAFLGKAFAEGRQVKKLYWAIVEKSKAAESLALRGELVHRLGFSGKTNKTFAVTANIDSEEKRLKKAALRYRVTGQGDHYLFLEVELVTGRHHQIRAQLAAVGLHIKGDLKYGARRSEKGGGIRLHARSLSFPNPLNPAETIRAQAPPPRMDSLWTSFVNGFLSDDTQ